MRHGRTQNLPQNREQYNRNTQARRKLEELKEQERGDTDFHFKDGSAKHGR